MATSEGRDRNLPKYLSKSLAIELATRTVSVVNPQNRTMALNAGLRKHGVPQREDPNPDALLEHKALVAWLLKTYGSARV